MKEIPLTQGKVALVDDEDFEELSKHKWCAKKSFRTFYPERLKEGKTYRMYWQILGKPEKGLCVDHIDGDGLNNQKSNLRICTNSQNQANRPASKHNKLGLKGVHLCYFNGNPNKPAYRAQIKSGGKVKHIGYFKTPEEAHTAYKKAAEETHGEFAQA